MFIVIKGPEIAFSEWIPNIDGDFSYYPLGAWFSKKMNGSPTCFIPLTPYLSTLNERMKSDEYYLTMSPKMITALPKYLGLEITSLTPEQKGKPTAFDQIYRVTAISRHGNSYLFKDNNHIEIASLNHSLGDYVYNDRPQGKDKDGKVNRSDKDQIFVYCNNRQLRVMLTAALDICDTIQEAVELAVRHFCAVRHPVVYTTIGNLGFMLDLMYVFKFDKDPILNRIQQMRDNKLRRNEVWTLNYLEKVEEYKKLDAVHKRAYHRKFMETPYRPL